MQLRLLLASTALVCLAAAPALDHLNFGPEAESTISKSFETTIDFGLDDLMVNFNDQEMDPAMFGMDLADANMSATVLIEVEDTYGEVKDGRPLKLTRVFNTVSGEVESGDGQRESGSDEDLEGTTLTFTWDPDSESYNLAADDDDLDLDELSHSGEDMDLRGLLPGEEISEGDSWEADGSKVLSVLWPGADWDRLQASAREKLSDSAVPAELEELATELVKKAILECTYEGTREAGGDTLQVISLAGEIEHSMEVGEMLLELIRSESEDDTAMSLDATVEIAAQLKGELLWDSAAGHFHTCEMDVELALLGRFAGEADVQGNPMSATADVEASGMLRRRASAR